MFDLALIGHDAKKEDMLLLVKAHLKSLSQLKLVATKGTGMLIKENTGLDIELFLPGPEGGDQQIGALVAGSGVRAVVFLRDPLTAHPHEPDVSALLRVCDVHSVPLATNLATAEAVIHLLTEQPELVGRQNILRHLNGVIEKA